MFQSIHRLNLGLFGGLLVSLGNGETDPCPKFSASSNYYIVEDLCSSWTREEASSYCDSTFGTDLAKITSNALNVEISNLRDSFSNANEFSGWIGLNDINKETEWKWSDDTSVTYTNWFEGEPNNYGTGQDCAVLARKTTHWDDRNCNDNLYTFFCNIDYDYTDDSLGKIAAYRYTLANYNPYWVYNFVVNHLSLAFLGVWRIWMNTIPIVYSIDNLPLSSEITGNINDINCNDNENNILYRTLDGTCNDLDIPLMGSLNTRFNRMAPLDWSFSEPLNNNNDADNSNYGLLSPNPRNIAKDLLHEDNINNPKQSADHLNLLVVSWIQFMIHDWVDHGENELLENNPIKVPLDEDDPWYDANNDENTYNIGRTQIDETYGTKPGDITDYPQSYQNKVTSWWDSNMIYGTDSETNNNLRDPDNPGKLKIDYNDVLNSYHLKFDRENNKEMTGFNRNWWIGLSLLHTLFTLEHNSIVDGLYATYGDLYTDDERYNLARLIVSGLIAKIHTIEWTPAILNSDRLDIDMKTAMKANWYGVEWNDLMSNGCELNPVTTEYYLLLNQLKQLGTVLKGGTKQYVSKYYNFAEEFVSVYRMHPLLPDQFNFETFDCYLDDVYNDMGGTTDGSNSNSNSNSNGNNDMEYCQRETINFEHLLHGFNTITIQDQYSHEDLMYSFGAKNSPFALHLNGYSSSLTDLYDPVTDTHIDLATIDLIRQRERGVPRYNQYRESLGLPKIESFEEIIEDENILAKLRKYYNSVDEMDFLIGIFAENQGGKKIPNGWIFGETIFGLFIQAASLRISADRFFTENYNSNYYTEFGIAWIELNSFKDVIARHYPDLVEIIPQNAFFKWSQDACDSC